MSASLSPRRSRWFAAVLALATAAGMLATLVAASSADAVTLPNNFKSVGYLPSWSGSVNGIQRAVDNPSKLSSLVSLSHANNVKVSISVGGWNNGDDSAFEALAANGTGRTTFVNSIVNLINQYGLDGVDVDWEYPDPGASGDNFSLLMQQLSSAMHSRGKLLTAAVVSDGYTAGGVQPAVFGYVDWLNIMAYDGGSPHANYDWAINSVNFWKSRGLPASKAVFGVPFYSRPNYYTYAQLVTMDPANANRDCTWVSGVQQCYNGVPTIKRKTQWAMAYAGGMMNWELSQDTTGSTSLVTAIYDTATAGAGARVGQI